MQSITVVKNGKKANSEQNYRYKNCRKKRKAWILYAYCSESNQTTAVTFSQGYYFFQEFFYHIYEKHNLFSIIYFRMNYDDCSASDFAADDYFIKWVKQPDEETEKF